MLRICLIIAIVAGLAGGTVSVLQVRQKMIETMNQRDQEKKDKEIAQADAKKTHAELTATQGKLKSTEIKLASTEAELKTVTAKADELDKQKTELTAQLEKTKADRDTALQQLMRWDLLGMTVDQIKQLAIDKKQMTVERDAIAKENKILIQKRNELQAKIDYFFGPDGVPSLPVGLKGKILAVDPKFQFVVLDIGGEQGVIERGEMLVNRNGKMIGKLRIATVDKARCIANILPGWKQAELMEGDQVITTSSN